MHLLPRALLFRAVRTAGCELARPWREAMHELHLLARRLAQALGVQDVLHSRAVCCGHVHVVIRAQRILQ